MKHKLLLLFFIINLPSFSQTITWQNTIGGNDYDWADFIESTKDGNYISGGYSYSNISGDKTENSRGANDYWIFKIDDSSGNLLWQKTIGGNGNDHLTAAKETQDGGYILGGYSSSGISGEKTQTSRGGDDYWVIKLDVNRNIVWDKTFGGTGTDRLTCIIETADGGYLMGGSSDSNISGDKTESSRGEIDMWLIKINAAGTIEWQKTFGGLKQDWVESIIPNSTGGYLLAGSSHSNISGEKTENSKGVGDFWILKIDASGSIIWQKTIGGNNGDYAKSIVAAPDGNYIIGGESSSTISGNKTQNTVSNSNDIWLVKLNDNGQLIWQKNIGGNSTETLENIRLTSDNGLILGAMSSSDASGDKSENSRGNRDYWIIKLDYNGLIEWDKTLGGDNLDQTQSVVEAKDGGFVTVGWSQSNISGDKTENKSGLQDFWVVKLKICNQTFPQSLSATKSPQIFCIDRNAIINNIEINGQNIKWYNAQTAGSLLPNTTLLQNGTTYYASQTSNGCESSRFPVTINIQNTPPPTGNINQPFCSAQNATIANLDVTGNSIKWYEASNEGSLLAETTTLADGKTYYASQTVNNCESQRFAVTVSIGNTPLAPTQRKDAVFCKNENATLNSIQVTGQNLKWYSSNIAAGFLPNTTLLQNNITYYVSQTVGCESDRTPILVRVYDTALPTGSTSKQFCIDENATLASIGIVGTNLKWYDSAINGSTLPETTLLQNTTYYATQTENNCESKRLAVTVKIQDTQPPTAASPQRFCTQKKASLNDIAITGENIKWFDSAFSDISLSGSTPLENGITYYASQTINSCESDRIPITIQILEATTGYCIDFVDELPYPKYFTPNNDTFHDTWTIDFSYLAPNTGIRIFDRYGKFIKELHKDTAWDGTSLGQQRPASDYWFIATRLNGTEFRGHFSLKR